MCQIFVILLRIMCPSILVNADSPVPLFHQIARQIREAIDNGARRLGFGAGLEKTKARRGCSRVRAHLYYRASSKARHAAMAPWFRLHAAWMARKANAGDRRVFGRG